MCRGVQFVEVNGGHVNVVGDNLCIGATDEADVGLCQDECLLHSYPCANATPTIESVRHGFVAKHAEQRHCRSTVMRFLIRGHHVVEPLAPGSIREVMNGCSG